MMEPSFEKLRALLAEAGLDFIIMKSACRRIGGVDVVGWARESGGDERNDPWN